MKVKMCRAAHVINWALFCSLPGVLACPGVKPDIGTIDEEMNVTTVVFGRAVDQEFRPLADVKVTLLGDKIYETKTDNNGYYNFDKVFVAKARALISIAESAETDGQFGNAPGDDNVANAAYTLLFMHEKLATFRAAVELGASIHGTATSYFFEAEPFNYDATLVPFADFKVQLVLGEANEDSTWRPAEGARVEIRPSSTSINTNNSGNFETYAVSKWSDAQGMASFDARDRLAATDGYYLVVYPSDINPDARDGFEYDTTIKSPIDLAPYTAFYNSVEDIGAPAANGNFQPHVMVVNLSDSQTHADPKIVFSQPAAGQEINRNTPLRFYFSRSMNPKMYRYEVQGCSGTCTGNGSVLLSQEIERTSLTLAFSVVDQLTPLFDGFSVKVCGEDYRGVTLKETSTSGGIPTITACETINFSLDDDTLPLGITIPKPNLLLSQADESQSLSYFAAIDAASIYVFNSSARGKDSYVGSMYSTTSDTLLPDGTNTFPNSQADFDLEIYFPAVPNATGYRIYAKDSMGVTSWVQVGNIGANTYSEGPNDVLPPPNGAVVSTSIKIPAIFDVFGNDSVRTPFCCGNGVQIAVLPYFAIASSADDQIINTITMPAIDPNMILTLSDNYGPAIMPPNMETFATAAGVMTTVTDTGTGTDILYYNKVATLAFSEYMDPNEIPTVIAPGQSGIGVMAMSGRFDIEWVRPVEDNPAISGAWSVQLQPRTVSADDLYIGDTLPAKGANLDDASPATCTVVGIDECTDPNNPVIYCDKEGKVERMSDNQYTLLGPVRAAGNRFIDVEIDSTSQARRILLDIEDVNEGAGAYFYSSLKWGIKSGDDSLVVVSGSKADLTGYSLGRVTLGTEITTNITFDSNSVLTNQPSIVLVDPAVPSSVDTGGVTLAVSSTRALVVGDIVTIVDGEQTEMVKIAANGVDAAASTIEVGQLTYEHVAGTPIAIYPYATLAEAADSGSGTIVINDPNGVTSSFSPTAGTALELGSEGNSEVVYVATATGTTWTIDSDNSDPTGGNEPLRLNHEAGEVVKLLGAEIRILGIEQSINWATEANLQGNESGTNDATNVDANGLRPGMSVTFSIGHSGTGGDVSVERQDYIVCAILEDRLVLDRTDQLHRIQYAWDYIQPLSESDVRPGDSLRVFAHDAAGNPMRASADTILGDGTVE